MTRFCTTASWTGSPVVLVGGAAIGEEALSDSDEMIREEGDED